jgi:hypothetical protein
LKLSVQYATRVIKEKVRIGTHDLPAPKSNTTPSGAFFGGHNNLVFASRAFWSTPLPNSTQKFDINTFEKADHLRSTVGSDRTAVIVGTKAVRKTNKMSYRGLMMLETLILMVSEKEYAIVLNFINLLILEQQILSHNMLSRKI